MFQNKTLIRFVISAAMTLMAVNFFFKSQKDSIENSYGMVEVLASSRDIPPHTQLVPAYLTTQRVPRKFMQPGAFIVKIPSESLAYVQGKVTVTAIPSGAQITQANLVSPTKNDPGIAPMIPPGKRGYVLRLGNLDVADLILPGDHIDVLATFTVKEKDAASKATYTILQNILVVAVGREIRKKDQDVSAKKEGMEGLNLTLAVDPSEAERLALAQAESQDLISIIVRPHGENDVRPVPGMTPAHLLG